MTDGGSGSADGAEAPASEDSGGIDLGAVWDTLVYAPLGLALEGRTLLPRLVERGRNHVTMARMVGEFAVRKGAEDLAAGAVGAQERVLSLLGQGGATGSPGSNAAASASRPPSTSPPTAARVSAEAAAAASGIDPTSLPIPDYDLLSASQVVPRLESLGDAELELVGRYEAGTRGRRTILAKVAQLRSAASE